MICTKNTRSTINSIKKQVDLENYGSQDFEKL